MPDERWERMWRLFHAAAELEPSRRGGFLEAECAGDEALLRDVAELLASHDAAGPLDLSPAQNAEVSGADLAGARVGRFLIRGRIGEGGMGVVYDAEQETPVRRRVALKVIHPGLHAAASARFALERQALALMGHPHIARVFDAGLTPDGRPFIAMEHVAGVPLGDYCDRHALDLEQRIELFLSVCHAIQHAHQKGLIHRDIKPSNVLVSIEDGRAMAKVIDFGIAKSIHPGVGERVHTRQEILVGTLEYMSPEQLDPSGLDVDTRSDIYSLGVVLYELVSGTLPFDWPSLRRAGLEGLRKVARETEAPRPSRRFRELSSERAAAVAAARRTTPSHLRRRLAGDLDWIVLKALDRDRTRRYPTASELADDLRRHLAHEPVRARPPATCYRLARFARRHRTAVALAAAGVVVLVVFVAATLAQSREVRRALLQADRERARAERVSRFLVEVFRAADPMEHGGADVTALALLDRGAERVTRELADDPEVKASVMSAIGRVYERLRGAEKAERLLREALALRRRMHGGNHADVAESLEELAVVLRGRADYAAAASLLEEAASMRRRLPSGGDVGPARSLFLLGTVERLRGDLDAAEGSLEEALRLCRRQAPAAAGAAGARGAPLAADILDELGAVATKKGDYARAEERLRGALALRREEQGRDAPRTAATLARLGTLLNERGNAEAAEPLLREALQILEQHLGPDHGALVAPLNNLALLLNNRGDYAQAEPLYRRALQLTRTRRGEAHPAVAVALNNLGLLLHDQGRFDEAASLFRQAQAVQRQVLGEGHADLAYPTTNLARVLHDQGRLAEAEVLYRQGLQLRRKALPAGHSALGDSLAWLGKLECERRRPAAAEPLLREAVAVRAAAFAADDWRTAEARSLLGACLVTQKRYSEAEPLLVEGYSIIERKRGKHYRRTLEALHRVVRLYEAWGRAEEATRHRRMLENNRAGVERTPAGG